MGYLFNCLSLILLIIGNSSATPIVIKSVAGGATGFTNGVRATSALLQAARGIAVDTIGNAYICEREPNNAIRKVSSFTNILTLYAGGIGTGSAGDGGIASSASFNAPFHIFLGSTGLLYVADNQNFVVRCINTNTNIITRFFGTYGATLMTDGASNGDNGPVSSAKINYPYGVWANLAGDVFVSDNSVHNVRKVSGGIVTTIAGSTGGPSFFGSSGDGGRATSAKMYVPFGVWGDSIGSALYVAEDSNHCVRRVSLTTGLISTSVGSTKVSGFSGDGGPASQATMAYTRHAIGDSVGNMYVTDYANFRLRKYTEGSTINTVLGTGTAANSGNDGLASLANVDYMYHLTANAAGSIYVVTGDQVRILIDPDNTLSPVTTPTAAPTTRPMIINSVAGGANGFTNGIRATSALLQAARGVAVDTIGNVYICERNPNNAIRKISTFTNILTLYAGGIGSGATGDDGLASSASFNIPFHIFLGSTGLLYIADNENYVVRQINTNTNIITRFFGNYGAALMTDGVSNGDNGPVSSAKLNLPYGVWANLAGDVFVSDNSVHNVRKVSGGIVTTIAGSTGGPSFFGSEGDGGRATSAKMNVPYGLWGDSIGSALYVAEDFNHCVRQVSFTTGLISTSVGTKVSGFSGDGGPASQAKIANTRHAIGDSVGNMYVTDYLNLRLRKFTEGSTINTIAGTGTAGNSGNDGLASLANVDYMFHLATNAAGSIYVVTGNQVRILINPDNTLSPVTIPTAAPTAKPTTISPSAVPSLSPSCVPTLSPSMLSSAIPTTSTPSVAPSFAPSTAPSVAPTTRTPSVAPSFTPSMYPTVSPSQQPSVSPSQAPSYVPTIPQASDSIKSSPSFKVQNQFAFASLTSNGTVLTWGSATEGGDSSSVSSELVDVKEVVQSRNAFAALKTDGTVVAWGLGSNIRGGDLYRSGVNVTQLVATEQAFAGVTSDGAVIAFGSKYSGGGFSRSGFAQYLTSDVVSIAATSGAFAALKADGTVFTWGNEFAGGGVSSLTLSSLRNIVQVSGTHSAFAAVTDSGDVTTLSGGFAVDGDTLVNHIISSGAAFAGSTVHGGITGWGRTDFPSDAVLFANEMKFIAHTSHAFAAVTADSKVVTWGDVTAGGDSSSVSSQLTASNVTAVVGNVRAFAAITSVGGVVAWGDADSGGSISSVIQAQLTSGVVSISATSRAFAALKTDGSVVVWGNSRYGGTMRSDVTALLMSDVRLICANEVAFTAIKTDGSMIAWGYYLSVGSGGLIRTDAETVVNC